MDLKTVEKVASQIELMKTAEEQRSPQRALLNAYFNGEPPWKPEEAKANQVLVNFNDKKGGDLLRQGRNQLTNAFTKRDRFFSVLLPNCHEDCCEDYEQAITNRINTPLKKSRPWYWTQDEVWGAVCLHGLGAKVWYDPQSPIPAFAGIQDILIPTDTHLSLENMECFALRRKMRPGKLFQKTMGAGNNCDPGWNLKAVKKLLKEYDDLNQNPNSYDWSTHPEEMVELWKQQSGMYYDSDKTPEIWFWDFFYREEGQNKAEPGWYQKILLDRDCVNGSSNVSDPIQFFYESKTPFAPTLDQIIHFQFGDGNNVPPFMVHSIRSLAYLTYELVWWMNRINCQFTQHLFEELMTFIRINDPADRGRLSKVTMTPPFGIIPDGLSIVTAQERYQPNYQLIESGLSQYKQRLGELSSTYTQQIDTGTQKERTKYEVQAVLAQTSALMSSVLTRAYRQEEFAYREIARRFAIKDSHDFTVKKFRNACIADGVPEKYLDFDQWDIQTEQVLGGGNRAMELAEATELFTNRDKFGPGAQAVIDHKWVIAISEDTALANILAPLDQKPRVSQSIHDAQLAFGTLMRGVDMNPIEGYSHTEQVAALLAAMAHEVEGIMQTDNMGTPRDLAGLQNVAKYIAKHLLVMDQNKANKAIVKKFSDDLNQLMNIIKGFAQRQQEAAKASQQPQPDPESMAKVASMQAETQQKLASKDATVRQGMAHKQAKFDQNQAITAAKAQSEIQRKTIQTLMTPPALPGNGR